MTKQNLRPCAKCHERPRYSTRKSYCRTCQREAQREANKRYRDKVRKSCGVTTAKGYTTQFSSEVNVDFTSHIAVEVTDDATLRLILRLTREGHFMPLRMRADGSLYMEFANDELFKRLWGLGK
jgi:hypothetical protein